jgi:hypothetical protein
VVTFQLPRKNFARAGQREGTPAMNAMIHRTIEALAGESHRVAAIHLERDGRVHSERIREIAETADVQPAQAGPDRIQPTTDEATPPPTRPTMQEKRA